VSGRKMKWGSVLLSDKEIEKELIGNIDRASELPAALSLVLLLLVLLLLLLAVLLGTA